MTQIMTSVRSVARETFKGQAPRVWTVMLSDSCWRAMVINAESKRVLISVRSNTQENALSLLKNKVDEIKLYHIVDDIDDDLNNV